MNERISNKEFHYIGRFTALHLKQKFASSFIVDDGAILDIILDDFCYGPPPGFDKIMLEQSLL